MVKLKGVFRDINGTKTTTLQPGDIIAFDPKTTRIAFIRPSEHIQYGVQRCVDQNMDRIEDLYLQPGLFFADFWNIVMLLSAATGLSAKQTRNYPSFEWAFQFTK